MEKMDKALRILLLVLSGISVYFLFGMNKSLSEVKNYMNKAQEHVGIAQDSIRKMQVRIDSLLITTQDAKVKMAELEQKANQVKIVYKDRERKDNATTNNADNVLANMREKRKKYANLKW